VPRAPLEECTALPRPLAGLRSPTSKGRKGKREKEGEGRGGEGRGKKGKR